MAPMINKLNTDFFFYNVNVKLYFLKHEYVYLTNGSLVNSYHSYNQPTERVFLFILYTF